VIGLEFPYIKLNLDSLFELTHVKPVKSRMGILLKFLTGDEEKLVISQEKRKQRIMKRN